MQSKLFSFGSQCGTDAKLEELRLVWLSTEINISDEFQGSKLKAES